MALRLVGVLSPAGSNPKFGRISCNFHKIFTNFMKFIRILARRYLAAQDEK